VADFILALDQGTSSSRAILFDGGGNIVSVSQREYPIAYPQPGWVEQSADDIWQTQSYVARDALNKIGAHAQQVAAIGISNQRETTVVWDKSGTPVAPAIVWQDRRTAALCDEMRAAGQEKLFRAKTGLLIDPYFSGTKVKWLLDNVSGARKRAQAGELMFGTVDTWLLYKLCGVHATDYSNASRTLIYNIFDRRWDDDLLLALNVPASLLPEVRASSGVLGETNLLGRPTPVTGVAGDQQAALFGQACFEPGMAKNTYGTGAFLLLNTGGTPPRTSETSGLLTTLAWGQGDRVTYALEGSVFIAGAAIQWLRDELGFIANAADSEGLATSVADSAGVYVVPAFTGLGAPQWDAHARGTIVGLTRGANKAHITRATLEAIAYQVRDVVEAMERDSGVRLNELRVDGGAAANNFLLQTQADILGRDVVRPECLETTALGAAYLAGLATGFWKDRADVTRHWREERRFTPQMPVDKREELYAGWLRAVERAKGWSA
jgi:glycerol kinase